MTLFFRGSEKGTTSPEITYTTTGSNATSNITWNPNITSSDVLSGQVNEYLDQTRLNAEELQTALRNYEQYLVTELERVRDLYEQLNPQTNGGTPQNDDLLIVAQPPAPKPKKRRKGGKTRPRPNEWGSGLSQPSYEKTLLTLYTLGEATNNELIKMSGVHDTSVRAATKWMRDEGEVRIVSGKGTGKDQYVFALTEKGRQKAQSIKQ